MSIRPSIRSFVLVAVLLASSCSSSVCAGDTRPLNVLFITVDDLNTRVGAYGDPHARTPHLDRLARQGVRFERAYAQYPVCSPSRVSFLSGLRPETTRVFDNTPNEIPLQALKRHVFLPQAFRQQGWFAARVGKVFHIGRDISECWDVSEEGTGLPRHTPQPKEIADLNLAPLIAEETKIARTKGESPWIVKLAAGDEATVDGRTAARIVDLLEAASRDARPFFIAAGFRRPHGPWMAPQRYFDAIDSAALPLPESEAPPLPGEIDTGRPLTPAEHRAAWHAYYAAIHFMDTQLGKLWTAMDRLQLWERTVVVLLGDHGYHLGERSDFYGKGMLSELACRAPLVIAAPGHAAGRSSPRIVELVDLYPTLADLCGVRIPANLAGRSLRPLLKDPEASWPHAARTVTAFSGRNEIRARSVRTERWRFTESLAPQAAAELYDHDADPREWHNQAADPRHARTVAGLRALLGGKD